MVRPSFSSPASYWKNKAVHHKRDLLILLLGFGLGLFVSILFSDNGDAQPNTPFTRDLLSLVGSETAPTSTKQEASLPQSPPPAEGWNPIHVFYGKQNHLLDPIPAGYWLKHRTATEQGDKMWFSQHGQDVAVAKALNFKTEGFFVDLAANDAVWASNTFVLEQNLDWRGICIEGNPMYWYRLAFRRRCHCLGAITGAKDFDEIRMALGDWRGTGPYSGIVGEEFDNKKVYKKGQEPRYTVRLETILERFGAPSRIDYLSLDVEGAETFIMRSFPFDKYQFTCLTIERPKDELKGLLTAAGYKMVMELKRGDTLWAHNSAYEDVKSNLAKEPEDIKRKWVKNLPAAVLE